MFAFLDIAIGLIFTYLILSLLASEIQEQIAALLEFRALHLKRAIKVLLGEDTLGKNSTVSRWVTRDVNKTPVLIPNDKVLEFSSGDPQQVWLSTDNRVLATRDAEVQITPATNTGKLIIDGTEVRKVEIELQTNKPQSLTDLLYANSEIRDLNQYAIGFLVGTILRFRIRPAANKTKQQYSEGPSYIPPETFSVSLLEVIQDQLFPGNKLNVTTETLESFIEKINTLPFSDTTKQRIIQTAQRLELKAQRAALTSANPLPGQAEVLFPLQEIRKELQNWYEKSMVPTTGVYKRNAKGLSLIIGLIMAVFLNINAFNIINALQNQDARSALISRAEKISQDQDLFTKCVNSKSNSISKAQVNQECSAYINSYFQQINDTAPALNIGWKSTDILTGLKTEVTTNGLAIIGWIISAIAISMGAPFWFDILSRVMNVRNANKPKQMNTQNSITPESNNSQQRE